MSKARQKGTAWETELLPRLRQLFGETVNRAPLRGVHDAGDFINVPWLHEAKNTIKPLFQTWARICERKTGDRWVIIWKGDRRQTSGNGPYVLMPLTHYERIVKGDIDGV